MGLNRFIENDTVIGVIGIVGGAFLAWLSLKIFMEVRQGITVDLTTQQDVGLGPACGRPLDERF